MEDYQFGGSLSQAIVNDSIEERKQAAADVLSNYSQFAIVCLGEGVRPCDLRLHLMKEISGMPTSLTLIKRKPRQRIVSPDSAMGESSSSGGTRGGDKTDVL